MRYISWALYFLAGAAAMSTFISWRNPGEMGRLVFPTNFDEHGREMTKSDVDCIFTPGQPGGTAMIHAGTYLRIPPEIQEWCGFKPSLIEGAK